MKKELLDCYSVASFAEILIDLVGTEFQKKVWRALMKIPYGQTRTYKQIAEQIGHPKAYRAVGLANSENPLWVIIPCHRVINSDGSLGGYAGGVRLKKFLLEHERAQMD